MVATLYVTANVVEASVTIDGQSGVTPATFTFPAGSYIITATYQTETLSQPVTLIDGETTTISLIFPINIGTLLVRSLSGTQEFSGVAVTIDGQSGTTPATFSLPTGVYSVTATYQGVTLPAQNIEIVASQIVEITLVFPEIYYTLTVNSTPIQGIAITVMEVS